MICPLEFINKFNSQHHVLEVIESEILIFPMTVNSGAFRRWLDWEVISVWIVVAL